MKDKIEFIPLDKIQVLNPRTRQRKLYTAVVESIKTLGLKKPIKVSKSSSKGGMYNLVYGQGRLEAFRELGHQTIPAIVVNISTEDALLMSLVENMARRFPRHADIILEIRRQADTGVSQATIAKKLGVSDALVSGYMLLSKAGEERLLHAVIRGQIPVGIAIEIARTGDVDTQRELLKAYRAKEVSQESIRVIKHIIDQRRLVGKSLTPVKRNSGANAQNLVHAFRKDADRKKAIVRKAQLCENRLLFIVGAMRKLVADEDFRNLLRAENLHSFPDFLAAKINPKLPEAA